MNRQVDTNRDGRDERWVESVFGRIWNGGGGNMFSGDHVFMRDDFFRLLDLEIKRARRYQNLFGVLKFELDDRRSKGTRSQGRNLKSVLKLLREEVRETDVVGQTKKNEIMILLPYCDSPGSEIVYARLSSLIRDFHFGDDELKIHSGFACFPTEGIDMTEILNKLATHEINGSVGGTN